MPPSLEYQKKDGTKGVSWDNRRGVARAVEEFIGTTFDEEGWCVICYITTRVSPALSVAEVVAGVADVVAGVGRGGGI